MNEQPTVHRYAVHYIDGAGDDQTDTFATLIEAAARQDWLAEAGRLSKVEDLHADRRTPLTDRLEAAAGTGTPTPSAVLAGVLAEYGLHVGWADGRLLGPDDLTVEQLAQIAYSIAVGMRGDE